MTEIILLNNQKVYSNESLCDLKHSTLYGKVKMIDAFYEESITVQDEEPSAKVTTINIVVPVYAIAYMREVSSTGGN